MDWEGTSQAWCDRDFTNFEYGKGEAIVVSRFKGDQTATIRTLTSKTDWETWFNKAAFLESKSRRVGFCIIICCRAAPVFDGIQASVNQLPFTRPVFCRMVQEFKLHPTITRTIGRQVPYFSLQRHGGGDDMEIEQLTCTARTSSYLADDLAIASTFFVDPGLSLGVVFGCTQSQVKDMLRRLEGFDPEKTHPCLLAALLSELERIRLLELSDRIIDSCKLRFDFREPGIYGSNILHLSEAEMAHLLDLCLHSRELVNQMKRAKRPLAAIIESSNSLEASSIVSEKTEAQHQEHHLTYSSISQTRKLMNVRLEEIASEYDDSIYECGMILDNMALVMQMAWSNFAREDNKMNLELAQVNTKLARANTGLSKNMQKDSSQMRSIALLTMIFLPLSTVASVFSTSFFTWNPVDGQPVVSGYIWIFAAVAVSLTSITVGSWWLGTHLATRGKKPEEELQLV